MRRAIATAAAVAALLAPSAARAVNPDREIVIYNDDTQRLTGFKKLNCKLKDSKTRLIAKGKSDDGWRIDIRANAFDGFGEEYPIAYGIRETNFAIYPTKASTPYYSNFFFPGDQPPPFGGELAVSGNGKRLGLGFIAAFSSASDDDAVGVVGHAKCKYSKRRKPAEPRLFS